MSRISTALCKTHQSIYLIALPRTFVDLAYCHNCIATHYTYRRSIYKSSNNLKIPSAQSSVEDASLPYRACYHFVCVSARILSRDGWTTFVVVVVIVGLKLREVAGQLLRRDRWPMLPHMRKFLLLLLLVVGIWAFELGYRPQGWYLGLRAGIWALALGFEPQGWDLGLEAGIWASRLGYRS